MLQFWGQDWHHYMWYTKDKTEVTQDRKKINPSKLLLRGLLETKNKSKTCCFNNEEQALPLCRVYVDS